MIKAMRPKTALMALAIGAALTVTAPSNGALAQGGAVAQQIANHFASVKTMRGEFVQFGPRGEQTGGTFQIARPGRIRFDYEPPAQFSVVSDGKNVVMNNKKLRTYDMYPLSKTPLKLLLDERIDLSGGRVKKVSAEPDLVTIVMADKSVFGNASITMMFDPKSNELRQWTITDAQGKDTTVMLFNVKEGASVDSSKFSIDYERVNRQAMQSNTKGR